MRTYFFLDTDLQGNAEYDISGNNYADLIDICCKYSSVLSLMIENKRVKLVKQLESFRIAQPKNIQNEYTRYSQNDDGAGLDIRYYRVCDELCNLLKSSANSIFDWVYGQGHNKPEDPIFYREDGSKFFSSVIHECECTLCIAEGENADIVICNGNWVEESHS